MLVPVVQVRAVRVVVLDGVVMVRVGVRTFHRRVVLVVVVPVIVGVGVLVIELAVTVPVMMALRHVEVRGRSEEDGGQRYQPGIAAISEHERHGGAEERSQRKQRAGASRPQQALGSQVQAQAQTVAGSATGYEGEERCAAWPRVTKLERQRGGQRRSQRSLPKHHRTRLEIGKWPRDGVVEPPR